MTLRCGHKLGPRSSRPKSEKNGELMRQRGPLATRSQLQLVRNVLPG